LMGSPVINLHLSLNLKQEKFMITDKIIGYLVAFIPHNGQKLSEYMT
jgi:hypothetical protein